MVPAGLRAAAAAQPRGVAAAWRALCSSAADGMTPAEAYLDSFINWETRGVPAAAGVAGQQPADGDSDSGAAAAGASTVFDLRRMHTLLAHLGDPQRALPVVHVAGTKGKGSVSVMLAAMLRAAGYRVGCYTSPHLFHLSERIHCPAASAARWAGGGGSCSGAPITREAIEVLVQSARGAVDDAARAVAAAAPGPGEEAALSHFEVTTALALLHFAREAADLAVVETGLGGATDATNVFPPERLQAAVVTAIGLDHVAALGGSLGSIAAAKAGIFRPGRPAVLAAQPHKEALRVVEEAAARQGCPVTRADQLVQVTSQAPELMPGPSPHCARQAVDVGVAAEAAVGDGDALALSGVRMQLVGLHQQANVAAAVAAVMRLRSEGWVVPDAAVARGLQDAFLPGRFQVARPDSQGPAYILDGAHTADSAAALAANVRSLFPAAPIMLVVAMAGDKEHRETLAALRAMEPSVVLFTNVKIAGSYQRSAPPGALAAHWGAAAILSTGKAFRCRELILPSLTAAMQKARYELVSRGHAAAGVVCVTGSLHAVAMAMKHLGLE